MPMRVPKSRQAAAPPAGEGGSAQNGDRECCCARQRVAAPPRQSRFERCRGVMAALYGHAGAWEEV